MNSAVYKGRTFDIAWIHTREHLCHRDCGITSAIGAEQIKSITKVNPPQTENTGTSSPFPTCYRTLVPPPVSQPLPANRKQLLVWEEKTQTHTKTHNNAHPKTNQTTQTNKPKHKLLSIFGALVATCLMNLRHIFWLQDSRQGTCFKFWIIYNKQFLQDS